MNQPVLPALVAILILSGCGAPRTPTSTTETTRPAAHEWYFWTDDGVRHYVVELGSGPTITVLHGGWGAEHSYLLDVVRPLANRYRFVLYDQRGSLRSPAPDETISLSRLVADLDKLRQESGSETLTLLTHSMGSQLACAYLGRHPDRVRAMVMLSPVIPPGAVSGEATARAHGRFVQFAQANEAKQLAAEGLTGRDWKDLSDREKSARNQISFASGNLYFPERWRQLRGGQIFFNGRMYPLLRENTPVAKWEGLFDGLKQHTKPLFMIIGDHDLVDFGLASLPELQKGLPGSELMVIDRAGHNAWIDQPAAVEAALDRALSSVAADPGQVH